MYYPCSENKGADHLRGYREADLRLCFRIFRSFVFSLGGSYITEYETSLTNEVSSIFVDKQYTSTIGVTYSNSSI